MIKNRRLIGPTILSLLLCGLLIDYLYFRESPWSVVRLARKILPIFTAIFVSAFNPANYGWFSEISLPVTMIGLTIIFLLLVVARAKKAMIRATPELDAAAPANPRRYGLLGKLTFSFAAVGILFGASAYIIVYGFLCRVIDREIKSRADITALGINEIAASRLAVGNIQGLAGDVARYASTNVFAYIYVEDGEGKIIAHEPQDLPIYLKRDFPRSAERALHGADVEYRGVGVYEIAKRMGSGKEGFIHLGLWHDMIAAESRRAVAPIAAAIVALLIGMLGAFLYVVRSVNRPFFELVEHAERISKGEFAVPLGLKRADEIGDIARSLERMRSSLHAVVSRLEQRQLTQKSNK